MKKVLVIGATGTIGRPLTKALLRNPEYKVTVFARHAKSQWKGVDHVSAIDGDATSEQDLAMAVAGQDVIYCAFLILQLPQVARNLVRIMEQVNNSRLIFMSSVGIYNEIPQELDAMDNLENNPSQIHNRQGADIVENSNLNYTIVRSGYWQLGNEEDFVLTNKMEPAKGYVTTISSLISFLVQLSTNVGDYARANVSITKDMRLKKGVKNEK